MEKAYPERLALSPNLSARASLESVSSEDSSHPRRGWARGRNFAFALTVLAILTFAFAVMVAALITLPVLNWPPGPQEREGKLSGIPSAIATQGHPQDGNDLSCATALHYDSYTQSTSMIQSDLETRPVGYSMKIAMVSKQLDPRNLSGKPCMGRCISAVRSAQARPVSAFDRTKQGGSQRWQGWPPFG